MNITSYHETKALELDSPSVVKRILSCPLLLLSINNKTRAAVIVVLF